MAKENTKIRLSDVVGGGYNDFWHDKHRYRVLKGGRASKKSTTTALWFIHNIMKYPGANALVVRQVYNTHKDSTFAMLKWAATRLGVYNKWKFTEVPLECTYKPTGQKILFRGFDDPLKLTSITVDKGALCWVWIEEAYELESEDEFRVLDETIRGEMPEGLWKQITLTFNPWVNTHWTKERFFDHTDPQAFTLTTTYKCNEWLDDGDKKLIEDTAVTNPDRYKVIGLGEYGIPGGAFFDEFRADIHAIDNFPIPIHWTRFVSIDYGLDMLAALWIAVDERGAAYVYKELYQSNLIISDAAMRILEINNNENIRLYYAPPDMWNRRQESGKSVADWFREYGIYLFKSSNDREDGWLSVKEWLKPYETKDMETGKPYKTAKLRIFKNCFNLIRTLPQIKSDEKNPNIVDDERGTKSHELTHAPDALRYFCVMRHRPSDPIPEKKRKDLYQVWFGNEQENSGEPSESYIYMQVGGMR